MNFHEGEFDAILDKATLDAVLVLFCLSNSAARTPQLMPASLYQKFTEFSQRQVFTYAYHTDNPSTDSVTYKNQNTSGL